MAKKKQKCVPSAELLKSVDRALGALEKARKQANVLARHEKRAIAAILEVEALVEDAKACNRIDANKKKSSKKSKKSKKIKSAKPQAGKVEMATVADIDTPLLSLTSLKNTLDAPLNNTADELHLISGVGPKLEELLHGLGIYHFDQIANWSNEEVEWVDDYMQFSGRIVRDNWIEQAKALAKGGRDEYVKVFGKEPC